MSLLAKSKKNETKKEDNTSHTQRKKTEGERKSKAKMKIVKAEELRERVEQLGALTTKVSKSSFLGCIEICLFGLTRAIESRFRMQQVHIKQGFSRFCFFFFSHGKIPDSLCNRRR